jgi:energy-coupling factor transport system ATP-binding protein
MQILAKNLSYIYNKKSPFAVKALDNVSLEIEEGEFYGIIGHTGSGKSTFLQHLNALLPVMEGHLYIGKYDLSDKKCNFRELRSKVGMVFQYPEYQLFADTVYDDVAFGLKNFMPEIKGNELSQHIKEALEIVGLNFNEVKNKSPFDLSGGQKRRVAIAGVIATKPEILVLDEPAAGLDPKGKKEIMDFLHLLHKNWCKTIVFVSHDMDEIAENCTNVAVFNKGGIEVVLPPKQLFKKSDRLLELGLDIPVTAAATLKLKKYGIDIDTDFNTDDFIKKTVELYNKYQ